MGAHASAIPILQWNQLGGDLRIAHFLGIHAQQALPLFGWGMVHARIRRPRRAILGAAIVYAALTAAALIYALARGRVLG